MIGLDASLKRIAWAYGCARKGSLEEAQLRDLFFRKVEEERRAKQEPTGDPTAMDAIADRIQYVHDLFSEDYDVAPEGDGDKHAGLWRICEICESEWRPGLAPSHRSGCPVLAVVAYVTWADGKVERINRARRLDLEQLEHTRAELLAARERHAEAECERDNAQAGHSAALDGMDEARRHIVDDLAGIRVRPHEWGNREAIAKHQRAVAVERYGLEWADEHYPEGRS